MTGTDTNGKKLSKRWYDMNLPKGLEVGGATKKSAFELYYNADSLMVMYLREEPSLVKTEETGPNRYTFCKGKPLGALVAFKHEGKLCIGWSKRCSKVGKDGAPMERRKFTKRDALLTAIIRGLSDAIDFKSVKYAVNGAGKVIPHLVVKELPTFINRAHKASLFQTVEDGNVTNKL